MSVVRQCEKLEVVVAAEFVHSIRQEANRNALPAPIIDSVDQIFICRAANNNQMLLAVYVFWIERLFKIKCLLVR